MQMKATHYKFISAILHASIAIAKKTHHSRYIYNFAKDVSSEVYCAIVLCIAKRKSRNIKIGYAVTVMENDQVIWPF